MLSMLRRVQENLTRRTATPIEMYGGCFQHNYEAPTVSSRDSLRHLTVTCILKIKCHRTYILQNIRLVSSNKSYGGEVSFHFAYACISIYLQGVNKIMETTKIEE
jgi:hypothetical protein